MARALVSVAFLFCAGCGGGSSDTSTILDLPAIQAINVSASKSGEAWPGQTLYCAPTTSFSSPFGAVYRYDFLNATGTSVGDSYVVQSSDIGRYISCRVTILDPMSSGNSVAGVSANVSIINQITTPCLIEDEQFVTTAGGCRSTSAGLTISRLSPTIQNLGTGANYCSALRDSGFSDWRLPSGDELASLLIANNGNFSSNGYSNFLVLNFVGAEAPAEWNGTSLFVGPSGGPSGNWIFCVR